MNIKTIEDTIGGTPLVRLRRLYQGPVTLAAKLESRNPAGSVKDRPAFWMVKRALAAGRIKPGDRLIEATSGNTGIALALAAAQLGLKMTLIMPDNMSLERRALMKAYGAEVILTPASGGMEASIDLARDMEASGQGLILDQFGNPDNPLAHYESTGPEIWTDTDGRVTHFVASTGTTGTVMGVSRFLKEKNPQVEIVGVRPDEAGGIPGIRAWPEAYLPKIFEPPRLDRTVEVSQAEAEETARRLVREEGISAGISSGGNVFAAVRLARELEAAGQTKALIVVIICDGMERYLSSGVWQG